MILIVLMLRALIVGDVPFQAMVLFGVLDFVTFFIGHYIGSSKKIEEE